MIRLRRGPEPAALPAIRERELNRLHTLQELRPPSSKDIGDEYKPFRAQLYATQHGKCCYCEWAEQSTGNPVEHIRPKTEADRRPGSTASEGYWWLGWTWENLAFACETCNGSRYKGIRFPLAAGSGVLAPGEQPPGTEQPLLIDPYSEEPAEWIEFVRDIAGGWTPRPRRGRPPERGTNTIRILGLAQRQELQTQRQTHADHVVYPVIRRVKLAIAAGEARQVVHEWNDALQNLFAVRMPFHALSRDILAAEFPAAERAAWGLQPLPGLLAP
jgi:uncharacterized protein (TIGR02646 family)